MKTQRPISPVRLGLIVLFILLIAGTSKILGESQFYLRSKANELGLPKLSGTNYGTCPLKNESNRCFEIVDCERAGGGIIGGNDSSCYRYIKYRCINKEGKKDRTRYLYPLSYCWSRPRAIAEIKRLCTCIPIPTSIPSIQPTQTIAPSAIPTIAPTDIPRPCNNSSCLFTCGIYDGPRNCRSAIKYGCSWCSATNHCINTSRIYFCDTKGTIVINRQYESCP